MRTSTKRTGNTGRPNKDGRSFPDLARRSPSIRQHTKTNSIENAQRNHERYLTLARSAETTGDATEIETLYQLAEHYLKLMREPAV